MSDENQTADKAHTESAATGNASQTAGNPGDSGAANTAATQDTNAQKAGTEGDASQKKEDAKAKTDTAPEKYEAFKLPEGMAVKPEMLDKFHALAKGYNLSQEKAQDLVALGADLVKQVEDDNAKKWTEIRDGWVKEIKSDQEFGGQKLQETVTRAQRTLKKYGGENMIQFLEKTGYGDNPDLIRMLAKIDRDMGEDRIIDGKPGQGAEKSAAEVLYTAPNK